MNPVITEGQARKITGGHKPLVPVEYEAAVKALQACVTLDEAKYWDNKADALAAWAKIYRNDEAVLEAKRLKLHAYRRMGTLAGEIRPFKNSREGRLPGPPALLQEQGLNRDQAKSARHLSNLSEKQFSRVISSRRPPAPSVVLRNSHTRSPSDSWKWIVAPRSLSSFIGVCRGHDPRALAKGLIDDEILKSRQMAKEVIEWLDAFEQALPKVK